MSQSQTQSEETSKSISEGSSGTNNSNKVNSQQQEQPVGIGNFFKLKFDDLNADFSVPPEFSKVKKLGKGAYGKVMQVMHLPTKKAYACKRFEQVFSNDLRAKRLIREINILKSVKHPCLNKLRCVFEPENEKEFDDIYLVLDMCDMDLKKLLKSSRYLQEPQVKSIIYDMLCGLNYLHRSQIIHRDLKPANILINDDCTIQICDFGLARSLKGVIKPQYIQDKPKKEMKGSISFKETPDKDIDEENNNEKEQLTQQQEKEQHVQITQEEQKQNSEDSTATNNKNEQSNVKPILKSSKPMLQKSKGIKGTGFMMNPKTVKVQFQEENKASGQLQTLGLQGKKLTQHVVTRWYRAPEVILNQDSYTSAIDIWSVGCIMAELLSMMQENYATVFDRQPLFPGTSCHMLSPKSQAQKDSEKMERKIQGLSDEEDEMKNDQLGKIFEVIGTPKTEEDLQFIKNDPKALQYVKSFKHQPPADLEEKYPGTDPNGLQLLSKMLEFSPIKRISAEDALKDPYFDEIRLPEQEQFNESEAAECDIDLQFEDDQEVSMDVLRTLILEEISKCKHTI